MLLLTSPNDQLQIVTSAAATISVHATWVDTNTSTGAITPGRTNTSISTAATTSIAGSPAAGVQRNVKTLFIRNTHATLASDVTVQHTDGTVVAQLYKMAMQPSNMLEYTDQGGFSRGAASTGTEKLGGRLTFVNATQLKFAPYDGGHIKLNGVLRAIPDAGIAGLANTNVRVANAPGQNLVANITYFVFVTDVAGVLTADFQNQSGAAHGRSTAPGNMGTEILKSTDGLSEFQTHSLIGMVRTNPSAQFQDDNGWRGVLSWFNRQTKSTLVGASGGISTDGAPADRVIGSGGIMMLNWEGEATSATLYADCGINDAQPGGYTHVAVGRDGTTQHGGGLWIYVEDVPNTGPVPTSVGGLDTPPEGQHNYYCIGGGLSNIAFMTLWVFNGTITGFTRG
jgi:hypothetical protein